MNNIPIPVPPSLDPLKSGAHTEFLRHASRLGIPDAYRSDYFDAIFAVAAWAKQAADTTQQTFCLGISGAQGSGKSTLATLLAQMLDSTFELPTSVLSLDDFYKTRAARSELGRQIHPLLQVRGVPGTHDMSWMNEAIADLKAGLDAHVPVFHKASDDRDGERVITGRLRILILEGWCWGARAVPERDLEAPVNSLEADQDKDSSWRQYANRCLASEDYQGAFRSADRLVYLAVPDMEAVYRWRLQQEQALGGRGDHVMNEEQVREFIMYYERITRRMLSDLPGRADITLYLDRDHGIESMELGSQ